MLKDFADIAPKAVLAAALLWGGSHYLLIGPDVAARIARADYLPACEQNYQAMVARAADARTRAVLQPQTHIEQDMAAAQLDALRSSPFMQQLGVFGGSGDILGLGQMSDMAMSQLHAQKQMARDAYDATVAKIKAQTATDLAQSGTICGCVADAAIEESRTEWAIFSGTLGLIRPAPVRDFDDQMMQVFEAGSCGNGGQP